MNKYTIQFESCGRSKSIAIHATSREDALDIFTTNFGPHKEVAIEETNQDRHIEMPWHYGGHFDEVSTRD